MADFGGFTIETPQEVLARLEQQRTPIRQNSDPRVRRNLQIMESIEKIQGGNPAVKAAEARMNRLKVAEIEAQKTVEQKGGGTAIDKEITRLRSIRRVEGLDADTRAQINSKLVSLEADSAERARLNAKEQRDIEAHNKTQRKAPDRLLELQNDVDKQRGLMEKLEAGSPSYRRAADRLLEVQQQINKLNTITGTTALDPTGLPRAFRARVLDDMDLDREILSKLEVGQANFNPDDFTIQGKAGFALDTALDKINLLPEGRRAEYGRKVVEMAAFADSSNIKIKQISGAAVTDSEAKRLEAVLIDPKNDSPETVANKLKLSTIIIRASLRARQDTLDTGTNALKFTYRDYMTSEEAQALGFEAGRGERLPPAAGEITPDSTEAEVQAAFKALFPEENN